MRSRMRARVRAWMHAGVVMTGMTGIVIVRYVVVGRDRRDGLGPYFDIIVRNRFYGTG